MQIAVSRNRHAHERAKECRVGIEQGCGKSALRDQILRAVEVLEQQVEQLGALKNSRLKEAPLVCWNQERNDVDLPGSICPQWIAVNVVGDAIFANAALSA